MTILHLAAALRLAMDDVCLLAPVSESEIEEALPGFLIVKSPVVGTPYEELFRLSLVVAFIAFDRQPNAKVLAAIDRMDEAKQALLEALDD